MQQFFIPNHILIPQIAAQLREGRSATFRVRGNSMQPFLEDGRDKVILSPLTKKEVAVGDVILSETKPEHYVMHRIIRIEGQRITMQGDGNVALTETFTADKIIGVVTGVIRKNRENQIVSIYDKKWRFYSLLWMRLTPIRRYLLAFYRRIWRKLIPIKSNDTSV